jgi:hypothetical protein
VTQPYSRTRIGPSVAALPAVTSADDTSVLAYQGKVYIVESGAWVPLRASVAGTAGSVARYTIGTSPAPSFATGWGHYQDINPSTSPPIEKVGYEVDSTGRVELRGLAGTTSGSTTGATSLIFTLPVGLRPASRRIYPLVTGAVNGTTITQGWGRLDIQPDGTVIIQASAGWTFIALDGISFMLPTATIGGAATTLTYSIVSGANAWPNFTLTFPVAGKYLWTPYASCVAAVAGAVAVQPRVAGTSVPIATGPNGYNLEAFSGYMPGNGAARYPLIPRPAFVTIDAPGPRTYSMTNQGNAQTDGSDSASGTLVLSQ